MEKLTPEEIMNKNINRRETMLNSLFGEEDGVMLPPSVKDMRIANEIMQSQEAATLKAKELGMKEKDQDISVAILEMLKNVATPLNPPLDVTKELESKEYDILPSELIETNEPLKLSDFTRGEEDE